jgi:lysophospholipase L1-like esterase
VIRLLSFLDRKITVRVPITIFIWLPELAYLTLEIYWCAEVGYAAIKWHTYLAPYLFMILIGFGLFTRMYRHGPSEVIKNAFLAFCSIVFALLGVESFLAISGSYKTYRENVDGYYISPYAAVDRSYYHLWTPGASHWLTKPEYSYSRPTNSLGFADREWRRERNGHELRILALGDSFTEGDGAPYDSSYVALFQQRLSALPDSFYVMNGGICGSDPFTNYVILRDKLLPYYPDMILQSIGSDDMMNDILIRGGLERFQKDGTVRYSSGPWWEPIYAASHISRVFIRKAGYNEVLIKDELNAEQKDRVLRHMEELFVQYDSLCKSNHIDLIVVLHPEKEELMNNSFRYDFAGLKAILEKHGVKVIDLLPSYHAYLERNHSDPRAYYWVYDGHHNSKGYKMMAETTFENILPLLRQGSEANK